MRRRLSVDSRSESGATLVEFSLIFGFLLMIGLGAFEYGMLFRDWMSVTIAAREGGRVAASAANYGDADCVILEAATGALQSLTSGEIEEVMIYRSDATGSFPGPSSSLTRRYSPFNPGDPSLVVCSGVPWNAEHLGSAWDPADRVSAAGVHWTGVRVSFEHEWMTDFLWWNGTVDFADDAIFRMEPPPPV
jgi:hypothetical protein